MSLDLQYPLICKITDGSLTDQNFLQYSESTVSKCRTAAAAGVSMIQVREKAISAKNLLDLTRRIVKAIEELPTKVVVNDRFDVAFAANADGVHLPSNGLPIEAVRGAAPKSFIVAVSTHSIPELERAASAGADLAVFGPVFQTPGKVEPVGLDDLRSACSVVVDLPVLALGGVGIEHLADLLEAGATGFAAIRSLEDHGQLRNIESATARYKIKQ